MVSVLREGNSVTVILSVLNTTSAVQTMRPNVTSKVIATAASSQTLVLEVQDTVSFRIIAKINIPKETNSLSTSTIV